MKVKEIFPILDFLQLILNLIELYIMQFISKIKKHSVNYPKIQIYVYFLFLL